MKIKNWTIIDPAAEGGSKLPAGGYVVRITGVEDVPSKQYLWIEYDIAEGDYAGHYSDDFAKSHPYVHRFSRSYKDSAERFFRAFLDALEVSNRGKFDVATWQERSDEGEFVGLLVGIVLQDELYTNTKGEDKERLNVCKVLAAQDIRNGDYTVPPAKDSREGGGASAPASTSAYSDIPFM